jgi:hypothetical protein
MHDITASYVRRKRAKPVTHVGELTITRARVLLLVVALPLLLANFLVPDSHYTLGEGDFPGDGTIVISVLSREGYVPFWRNVSQRSVDWERTFGQANVIFTLFVVTWVLTGRSRKRQRVVATRQSGQTTVPKCAVRPAASREERADEIAQQAIDLMNSNHGPIPDQALRLLHEAVEVYPTHQLALKELGRDGEP